MAGGVGVLGRTGALLLGAPKLRNLPKQRRVVPGDHQVVGGGRTQRRRLWAGGWREVLSLVDHFHAPKRQRPTERMRLAEKARRWSKRDKMALTSTPPRQRNVTDTRKLRNVNPLKHCNLYYKKNREGYFQYL